MAVVSVLFVAIKLAETIIGTVLYVITSGHWAGERVKNNKTVRFVAGLLAALLTYLALEPFLPIPKLEPLIGGFEAPAVPPTNNVHVPRPASQPSVGPAPNPMTIELEYWRSVARADEGAQYEEYLRRYPVGQFAEIARTRLMTLRSPKPPSGPPHDQPANPAPSPALEVSPGGGRQSGDSALPAPRKRPRKCVTFNGREICDDSASDD